jgi:hypothetical protein
MIPLPNESRLSCGAWRERSQTECHDTAFKTFSEFVERGADSFKRMLGRNWD